MAYIEFNNVFKVYKMGEVEIKALSNTSFKINKGEKNAKTINTMVSTK